MNNNLKFLLLGTSLSLIPTLTNAQCAVTDCLQLGYTSLQKCDNGLKCPFGEYWACPCDASYKYTCTGNNEQSGTDKCGDKYKSCTCDSGYEWKDGKCQTKGAILGQCTGYAQNCKIGDILNSDGTCTTDKVSGKEPIGVVIYIGGDNCGYAMTIGPIKGSIQWGGFGTDIRSLSNYENWQKAIKDFDAVGNTKKIIQSGNSNEYPAAWAAVNYTPSAAPATKGMWVLPSAGMLSSLYTNLNIVNNTLSKIGGIQPEDNRERIWSSSEASYTGAWGFCVDVGCRANQEGIDAINKNHEGGINVVRPVIAF